MHKCSSKRRSFSFKHDDHLTFMHLVLSGQSNMKSRRHNEFIRVLHRFFCEMNKKLLRIIIRICILSAKSRSTSRLCFVYLRTSQLVHSFAMARHALSFFSLNSFNYIAFAIASHSIVQFQNNNFARPRKNHLALFRPHFFVSRTKEIAINHRYSAEDIIHHSHDNLIA